MAQIPGTERLYPQTSAQGVPIPFEILDIIGLVFENFTGSGSSAILIPTGTDYLILWSDKDCYVKFNQSAATAPSESVFDDYCVYVKGNSEFPRFIALKDYLTVSVIKAGADDGRLVVEFGRLWEDLRKVKQVTNIG